MMLSFTQLLVPNTHQKHLALLFSSQMQPVWLFWPNTENVMWIRRFIAKTLSEVVRFNVRNRYTMLFREKDFNEYYIFSKQLKFEISNPLPSVFFSQVLQGWLSPFTVKSFQMSPVTGLPWEPSLKQNPNSGSHHFWTPFPALYFQNSGHSIIYLSTQVFILHFPN